DVVAATGRHLTRRAIRRGREWPVADGGAARGSRETRRARVAFRALCSCRADRAGSAGRTLRACGADRAGRAGRTVRAGRARRAGRTDERASARPDASGLRPIDGVADDVDVEVAVDAHDHIRRTDAGENGVAVRPGDTLEALDALSAGSTV